VPASHAVLLTALTLGTMAKWLRRVTLVPVVAVVAVSVTFVTGLTNAYGTGTQLQANVGPWLPDGAKGDTFWDSAVVDVPGFSVTSVHCHGQVRYDVQLGATGPSHSNPCYAALGAYTPFHFELRGWVLPGGNRVLYRCSTNDWRWIYYIGNVDYAPAPSANGGFDIAALTEGHCSRP
jgi:hypothetical protein